MQATKLIYCFVLLFLIQHRVLGQSFSFKHYGVESGLSNNAVMCSLQDKMGFLWFGTKDGLNRFDGYAFKTFRKSDKQGSIGNNFIHCLYEDSQGTLWVGTDKGLYQYLASIEQFRLVPATINMDIIKITRDNQGNFWLISAFALCRYSEQTGKLVYFDQNKYFQATNICTTGDGIVYAATIDGQLKKYHPENNTFSSLDLFQHSEPTASKWIESLYVTANGNLIAGTSNREIKLIDPHSFTYTDFTLPYNETSNLYIRSIQQTAPDEFWLGTESGIFVYNIKTGKCQSLKKDYNNPYSITDNAVYTFCRDREGGIWTGTYFGGINYFPRQFAPFTKLFPQKGENSLSGNVVREIKKDQYGNLWIGTEDAGLNKRNPATGQYTHYMPNGNSGISFFNIHGLLASGNELWIGTFNHGLDVMNIRTGKVIRHFQSGAGNALAHDFIYCIYQLSPEEILIGTPAGMYSYHRKNDSLLWKEGLPGWNWYSSVLKDKKGTLWAGTFGRGLFRYNPVTGKTENFTFNKKDPKSLSSDRVNFVFEDRQGNIWFATEEGLCKWNAATGDFTRYGTANGFPSDFILCMLEDSQNNLWISTTKGLVRFTPSNRKIQVYTTANGLLSDQFNYNSAFKDDDGRMYFGSAKGLISFRPEDFKENTFIPPIYITGFQVNHQETDIGRKGSPLQKSITYTDKITLTNDQSTISIDFAALGYTAPDMIQYRYQMEGLSNAWVDLKKNRRVDFMQLPPGRYTFRVRASNGTGTWSQKEAKMVIVVLPPWWASRWAKIIYALLGLSLIYFIVRSYHRQMVEKNRRKLELFQMEKEREILEFQLIKEKEILEAKVDFFTNVAHEIRTPLTLIKVPLARIMKKAAGMPELENSIKIMQRNTNRLIDLTNQLLDFRQTEINKFQLSIEKADISSLVEEAGAGFSTLAEQNNIALSLYLPKEPFYAYVDVDVFNKVIYNLFSNAVKYAASKTDIALLPLFKEENTFTIQVKNDGYLIPEELKEKIFEPFFRIRNSEAQTGTGIGLALSRSLAQLHNGILAFEPQQDNMNVFSLTLPIQQKAESLVMNQEIKFDQPTKENIKQ